MSAPDHDAGDNSALKSELQKATDARESEQGSLQSMFKAWVPGESARFDVLISLRFQGKMCYVRWGSTRE